jgi:GT2 family glycosyltransferase
LSKTYTYKLSVIVVNYNVEHFLDQCLHSVRRANESCSVETIIVDNASVDGSLTMLAAKYPEFQVVANTDNVGFSKANNQAIRIAKGEYVLLLNPDTVVAEDTFTKVIAFMDSHPEAGGLGTKMVDGKGRFLPESKRGLPTPAVAFYKIFGFSKIFPKSKRFGQYHLGNLSNDETNEVDILSGAFMLMRSAALDKVGLLDEDYFMYGEDIDLSYRIQNGGYKNYYFADTTIIHYKGESTKKSSVNYVLIFYKAMVIFAKKHFSGKNAFLFSSIINLAIYLRAFIALVSRVISKSFLPAIDFLYIVIGLHALTNYWKMSSIEFPSELIKYSIPIYSAAWILTAFINGSYDYPIKLLKFFRSLLLATIIILVAYAVLPKSYQFSRLFIFAGAAWASVYFLLSRLFLHFAIGGRFRLFTKNIQRFSILAKPDEFQRISGLLSQTQVKSNAIIQLDPESDQTSKLGEIVFSAKDMSYKEIIARMTHWTNHEQDFKIAPPDSTLLIGSNSIDTAGDLYLFNNNTLNTKENKRKKRIFDTVLSFLMLLAMPALIFTQEKKSKYAQNIRDVFLGRLTFVGFTDKEMKTDVRLPKMREGLVSPAEVMEIDSPGVREKLNVLYTRDYSMRKDLSIVLKLSRNLDR